MKRLVYLLILVICLWLPSPMYAQAESDVVTLMGAYKGKTVRIASTDTAALLETAYNAASGVTAITFTTGKVKAAWLTCETNDIRVAFGVAPTQGASGIGHILYVGQSMRIPSPSLLQRMYIISKTNLAVGAAQVTLEY